MSDFGLTINGFKIKDANTIRTDLEDSIKNIFGEDVDTTSSSVLGQLLGIEAQELFAQWELAQATYSCNNLDSAEGACLDNLVALNGFTRQPAIPSKAQVIVTGNHGLTITQGSLVKQSATDIQFSLDSDELLSEIDCYYLTLDITGISPLPQFTISMQDPDDITGTTTYSLVITGSGANLTDVVNSIVSAINNDSKLSQKLEANNVSNDVEIRQPDLSYDSDYFFSISGKNTTVQYLKAGNLTLVTAVEYGSITVSERTIDTPVTIINGWDSVLNYIDGTTGILEETDEELRNRYSTFISAGGKATESAIRSALLGLNGLVSTARVFSNRSDDYDSEGRPPHSFESIVSLEGGIDAGTISQEDKIRIGDVIWDTQPAGILSFGNVDVTVQDELDQDQLVSFSIVESVDVYVQVRFVRDKEILKEPNSTLLITIKQSIEAYANAIYSAGEDVYATQLIPAVYNDYTGSTSTPIPIPGVGGVIEILVGRVSPPSNSLEKFGLRDKAFFSEANITVLDETT